MSPNANIALFCCILPLLPVGISVATWFLLRAFARRHPRLVITPIEDPTAQRRKMVIELEMEERPYYIRRKQKQAEEAEQ
jgi:hypothetical protein